MEHRGSGYRGVGTHALCPSHPEAKATHEAVVSNGEATVGEACLGEIARGLSLIADGAGGPALAEVGGPTFLAEVVKEEVVVDILRKGLNRAGSGAV